MTTQNNQVHAEKLAEELMRDAMSAPMLVSAPALRLAAVIQMVVEDLYALEAKVDGITAPDPTNHSTDN